MLHLHAVGKSEGEIASELGLERSTIKRQLDPDWAERRRKRARGRYSSTQLHTRIEGSQRQRYRVKKRPKPRACELCRRWGLKLNWHHWDDEHLEWGLWLCQPCHNGVYLVEKDLVDTYLQLKSQIESNGSGDPEKANEILKILRRQ